MVVKNLCSGEKEQGWGGLFWGIVILNKCVMMIVHVEILGNLIQATLVQWLCTSTTLRREAEHLHTNTPFCVVCSCKYLTDSPEVQQNNS